MHELQFLILTVIVLALLFDFINGFHDTANAIATSVSTRAIKPAYAIVMAAALNFLGAIYSTGVAKTIGGDIVASAEMVDEEVFADRGARVDVHAGAAVRVFAHDARNQGHVLQIQLMREAVDVDGEESRRREA